MYNRNRLTKEEILSIAILFMIIGLCTVLLGHAIGFLLIFAAISVVWQADNIMKMIS